MTDDDRRIAVIGGGRMGTVHLRALATYDVAAVVVDSDPAIRARHEAHGRVTYGSVGSLLAAGDAAAVVAAIVAAPTSVHGDVCTELLRAGVPTLCEKPAGIDVATTRRLAAESARAGAVIQVGYWRRFVPALVELRATVASGTFGEISLVSSAQWDHRSPPREFIANSGGIAVDMGVHEFDQVRWLTGQEFSHVSWASSGVRVSSAGTDDPESGAVVAELSGGTVAVVTLGRSYPGGDMCRVELIGPDTATTEEFLTPSDGDGAFVDAVARQAEAFVRHAVDGTSWPGASIADAVAAFEVAEQVDALIRAQATR